MRRAEAGHLNDEMKIAVQAERDWRMERWHRLLEAGGPQGLSPSLIRELGIYVGQQGVYRDKKRTQHLAADGATVSVLHTGRHYPDDLLEEGIVYHYPRTGRAAAFDQGEVSATKAAGRLQLPIFVIIESPADATLRNVQLAWVEDWDDDEEVFLMAFGEMPLDRAVAGADSDGEFELTDADAERVVQQSTGVTRYGQQRFKLRVLRRYGKRCAVCGIDVPEMLEAAHLRPRGERGTDDPRNGLVFCASHHRAFDSGLFTIEPDSLEIRYQEGGSKAQVLRIECDSLRHLPELPHREALRWRWDKWLETVA